jgi:oxygen-independent coproporphyrinogen III oxidase
LAGIYIHIPFCKQACTYCNFHFSTTLTLKQSMVEAICKEIENVTVLYKTEIETLYFGGGTPSLLSEDELKLIFTALNKRFVFNPAIEITLEANPDDINEHSLTLWKQIGINRLSVGLQSFNNDELKWMNRTHTAAESLHCIDLIKAAGYTNFSIDLIYGSPLLSNEDWIKNIQIVTEKKVPHISCYALTVEPKTALAHYIAKDNHLQIDEEKQANQFSLLVDELNKAGYEHYEISNFAKPNYRSKHNSSYWQGKAYFGFGPSAHSFNGVNTRRWNIANNALYIQSIQKNIPYYEEEKLTATQQLNEYIMTAIRTIEGIDLENVKQKFGEEKCIALIEKSKKYFETKKLETINLKLALTNEGKFFADGIAADLFF